MPVKKSEMGIGRVITMGGAGLGVRGVKVASKRNRRENALNENGWSVYCFSASFASSPFAS